MYKGGYADVWKGEHRGREVAVKVIRTYSDDELRKIIHVGRSISAYQLFTGLCAEALQRGCDVEVPSTSECLTTARCLGVGESVCNSD